MYLVNSIQKRSTLPMNSMAPVEVSVIMNKNGRSSVNTLCSMVPIDVSPIIVEFTDCASAPFSSIVNLAFCKPSISLELVFDNQLILF